MLQGALRLRTRERRRAGLQGGRHHHPHQPDRRELVRGHDQRPVGLLPAQLRGSAGSATSVRGISAPPGPAPRSRPLRGAGPSLHSTSVPTPAPLRRGGGEDAAEFATREQARRVGWPPPRRIWLVFCFFFFGFCFFLVLLVLELRYFMSPARFLAVCTCKLGRRPLLVQILSLLWSSVRTNQGSRAAELGHASFTLGDTARGRASGAGGKAGLSLVEGQELCPPPAPVRGSCCRTLPLSLWTRGRPRSPDTAAAPRPLPRCRSGPRAQRRQRRAQQHYSTAPTLKPAPGWC